MIQKCDAISDDDTAVEQAILPIEQLARMGRFAEAIRNVNRFLRRLPRQKVLPTVSMAELGAKICLDVENLPRMEKYLKIAEATEPFNTRKCDRGFSFNSVREFRANNGLLDPAQAVDEDQRTRARFWGAKRRYKLAMASGARASAKAAVAEMEKIAGGVDEDLIRQLFIRLVIFCHVEQADAPAVRRCMRQLDKDARDRVLKGEVLIKLGLKAVPRQAAKHGTKDSTTSVRSDAVNAALDQQASTGPLHKALADARKLRSPTLQRRALAPLLAKAQQWAELRALLRQVESPEEAADLAWWIKFQLPGGEAR